MKRFFRRDLAALEEIFAFVGEFLRSRGFAESESFEIDLILEELFTNMVRHQPQADREIEIGLAGAGREVEIVLVDRGAEPFDLTRAPEVDPNLPLEQRRIGGLGVHFVRQMSDSLSYEHRDGVSTIKITKRLES